MFKCFKDGSGWRNLDRVIDQLNRRSPGLSNVGGDLRHECRTEIGRLVPPDARDGEQLWLGIGQTCCHRSECPIRENDEGRDSAIVGEALAQRAQALEEIGMRLFHLRDGLQLFPNRHRDPRPPEQDDLP